MERADRVDNLYYSPLTQYDLQSIDFFPHMINSYPLVEPKRSGLSRHLHITSKFLDLPDERYFSDPQCFYLSIAIKHIEIIRKPT